MHNYLLLTLGHNASAVFISDTNEIVAYEQERLDGMKSSSQFPTDAIHEIVKQVGPEKLRGCTIRVSHWFDFKANHAYENKYITFANMELLRQYSEDIWFVNESFTHHDAHAWSAYAFFKCHITGAQRATILSKPVYTIVADGFGNNGEVLSVYKSSMFMTGGKYKFTEPERIHRSYGYGGSLGLMYQYATSFCGMKENQDEYKFLGYEAHIDSQFSMSQIDVLNGIIKASVVEYTDELLGKLQLPTTSVGGVIDFKALQLVKDDLNQSFKVALKMVDIYEFDTFEARVAVAYLIQGIIEGVIGNVVRRFNMENVIVTGGIFYNVKLNNSILKSISGVFCAMPLAGDQGAAFGIYAKETGNSIDFDTLTYGRRNMYNIAEALKPFRKARVVGPGTELIDNIKDVAFEIADLIANGEIVNIVTGNMEFGPRALCHTSTLFLPTEELAAANNVNNNRNEVMPCAPVIREKHADKYFDRHELDRVVGSDKFMICTHEYKHSDGLMRRMHGGAMHKVPLMNAYTGRPQIVSSGLVCAIMQCVEDLTGMTMLVNTSFNSHGRPIAFDTMHIVENYKYQVEHSKTKVPYLYVVI